MRHLKLGLNTYFDSLRMGTRLIGIALLYDLSRCEGFTPAVGSNVFVNSVRIGLTQSLGERQ